PESSGCSADGCRVTGQESATRFTHILLTGGIILEPVPRTASRALGEPELVVEGGPERFYDFAPRIEVREMTGESDAKMLFFVLDQDRSRRKLEYRQVQIPIDGLPGPCIPAVPCPRVTGVQRTD